LTVEDPQSVAVGFAQLAVGKSLDALVRALKELAA
jgi:hypothetical protein